MLWGKGSIGKALPVNSNLPAPSCVNEPSKLDPCPTACYVLVLPKEQGKETRALQEKILPWLLKTIWQRKDVWKTLFQNKSSGTISPVYLPRNSWTTQRMCQSTKHCLSQLLPNIFILQLRRNIPWTTINNNDLDRVRLLNTCCITQKVRCWGGNNQKDTAKEQGHGRKTYKVFSLNSFY